jgi:hypothetical protein
VICISGSETGGELKGLAFQKMVWPGRYRGERGQQRDKLFAQALRMELAAAGEDLKELRAVARALIDEAKAGNIRAIQELGDRLDGKATQMLEHSAPTSLERRKLTYEIVHVTREEIDTRDRNLVVDYQEVKTVNGNGHDHADGEIKPVNGNGHGRE